MVSGTDNAKVMLNNGCRWTFQNIRAKKEVQELLHAGKVLNAITGNTSTVL
jgi:hypothetical protein